MDLAKTKILRNISLPEDLKDLALEDLMLLSSEIRQYIIDVVSANSGHLGASLGVVEMTVALHYVYNAPYDKIIWDVGHQAYVHKILTGRKDVFPTNRQFNGISGYPKREESKYDAFIGGHASTSISAALGMAMAAKNKGEKDKNIVAVIGDGSLTGGIAYEGLNNAGMQNANMLIILNDNNMAIDPNVGALQNYLIDITTSRTYNRLKKIIWNILGQLSKMGPNTQRFAQKLENSIKRFFLKKSELFESFNFRYFGPVDGHDIPHMIKLLEDLKDIPGPKILHCVTKKGKGFEHAEKDQTAWHSPGKFDKHTGEIFKVHSDKPAPSLYQKVFGVTLTELADKNDKLVAITPAMPTGSSINIMMKKYPQRVFDVGICEQHAVTFSAGLAAEGMIPFCSIYSTFMQRAYDQVINDVALQKLPVVLCLDRAGLVGSDGATHHGAFDISYFRGIPNLTIAAPMNEKELRNLMYTAQVRNNGPFVIRYPKGYGVNADWQKPFEEIPIGKGRIIKSGTDVAILSVGHTGNFVQQAISMLKQEQISIAHYDMRFVKPLDEDLLHQVFKNFRQLITVEDGVIKGGFGSALLEFMNEHNYHSNIKMLGIPDQFIEHGTQKELYRLCNYDVDSIYSSLKEFIQFGVISDAV